MMAAASPCPANSIIYNGSHCACPVGQLLNSSSNRCSPFAVRSGIWTDTGVDYFAVSFPETIFSLDSLKKLTRSQAVFLEATLVMVVLWLLFCFFLRFAKLHGGRSPWFSVRWWISRLDICFATRHWLEDRQVVVKRKTELGGTFSMASWILFIGLFAALLYQVISNRTIEVHNVRALNAPDLADFVTDMEFNLTTVSTMSCLNLRGLGTLATGTPGSIDYRVASLGDFVNFTCHNTSDGPTLSFSCSKCQFSKDSIYISWQFVDLPRAPATAVGFQFNLTSKNHAEMKHVSFVGGMLKNGSAFDARPVTFRGNDSNVFKFNLFPRMYRNLHNLRLIQPLFHEFLPGSFSHEISQLQASLETSSDGLINATLYINYLSAYVVEIESQNVMGLVSFLADLGGLYCFSIGVFFYFLVQCEYRIKRLRNEDKTMRQIRNRLKAQQRWDKLRKYVIYRWGCAKLDDSYKSTKQVPCCSDFMIPSVRGSGSLYGNGSRRSRSKNRLDSINFNKKSFGFTGEKDASVEGAPAGEIKSCIADSDFNSERRFLDTNQEHLMRGEMLSTSDGKQHSIGFFKERSSQSPAYPHTDSDIIPLPPPIEFKVGSEVDVSEIQKNLQLLYEYNVMLREKFIDTRSLLQTLASKCSASSKESSDSVRRK